MSLYVASLNSGSNGNCYYVGNDGEAVLVDAGLSCKETEKRMNLLGLSLNKVRAIFISHEHTDHIKGLESLAEKYRIPVYITSLTLKHSGCKISAELCRPFVAYNPVEIGKLTIKAFPKNHDAQDPHSFIISCNGISIGVFTDIGTACSHVLSNFTECHAAFLESNYDDEMLSNGRYPFFLKRRICGSNGHLSNKQALEVFTNYRSPFLSHLFLSHLSKDNNCPELAKKLFEAQSAYTKIVVASRYEPTAVYNIQAGPAKIERKVPAYRLEQLSLF